MIHVQTSIHDRFSVEFKIYFSGKEREHHQFKMNSWLFVPNSLNINAATYSKDQFYRDVKSNIRLKTPRFTLQQMVSADSQPLQYLSRAAQQATQEPSEEHLQNLEFHVKMYVAIYKSALRDETKALQTPRSLADATAWMSHLDAMRGVAAQYRTLMSRHQHSLPAAKPVFQYGDEYMSHLSEVYAIRLLRYCQSREDGMDAEVVRSLTDLIAAEHQYKIDKGYHHFSADNMAESRDMFQYQNTLKKYIESALYLKSDSHPDGAAAQQLSFGVAVGIAMLISMLIALPFQKYLGEYPILIFIILVVAYMFKDRIKEYARARFAHRLKSRFFDLKSNIFFRGREVAHIKEGVDFITDEKTPAEVLKARGRSDLENRIPLEQIILYRKQLDTDDDTFSERYEYRYDGINDITRIHLQHFTLKMDDPETKVGVMDKDGKINTGVIPRIYNLYIVLQCVVADTCEYHCFKLMMSRDGIQEFVEV